MRGHTPCRRVWGARHSHTLTHGRTQVWGDCQAAGLIPDCRLCITFIEVCTRLGQTDRALQMYAQVSCAHACARCACCGLIWATCPGWSVQGCRLSGAHSFLSQQQAPAGLLPRQPASLCPAHITSRQAPLLSLGLSLCPCTGAPRASRMAPSVLAYTVSIQPAHPDPLPTHTLLCRCAPRRPPAPWRPPCTRTLRACAQPRRAGSGGARWRSGRTCGPAAASPQVGGRGCGCVGAGVGARVWARAWVRVCGHRRRCGCVGTGTDAGVGVGVGWQSMVMGTWNMEQQSQH